MKNKCIWLKLWWSVHRNFNVKQYVCIKVFPSYLWTHSTGVEKGDKVSKQGDTRWLHGVVSSAVLVTTDQRLIYEITAASELLEITANHDQYKNCS